MKKRILLVDDERPLLDALRARLHTLRDKFEMVFVESGQRALVELEQQAFDVIVTDMRMPLMDGFELLNLVRERWPAVIRIVLSGYSEVGQSHRLLAVAHQYLSKPCEPQHLEHAVSRCTQLHEVLAEPALRELVGQIGQLPAMPRISAALREATERGSASIDEIARLISSDPAIAARVLQVVNSAFFRLARNIKRIDAAVTYLGFVAIRSIALSVEVFSQWRPNAALSDFDPQMLQMQAQKVAAVARALTRSSSMSDDALLAGLLHNIGYWILVQERPEQMKQALQIARERGIPLHEAERDVFGATHAEIGAYLLGLWGLPYDIVEAVAFQYSSKSIAQRSFDVLAVLATAKALVAQCAPEDRFGLASAGNSDVAQSCLESASAPFTWAQALLWAEQALGELQQ